MASPEESKLERFVEWLKFNGVELRGCNIKFCDSRKGFGIFLSNDVSNEVLLVVPLDLAITPMRVLQEPIIGPECRVMFEEGEVDDRFLMILFLTMEIVRKNSTWKPYLDLLPTTFGNPLWFTEDELLELKGTTLYQATEVQKKNLHTIFDDKVKNLVKKLLALDGNTESEVRFEDFLWANSIFWSRALSIPFPRSYVFPQIQNDKENAFSSFNENHEASVNNTSSKELVDGKGVEVCGVESQIPGVTVSSIQGETVWVEGLVPAIDFCNHDLRAAATWEVDGTGLTTGVPCSMYLLSAGQDHLQIKKEISINYGNKGNEELLYLYGFVIDDNPDDYLMVNYPLEAIQSAPFSEAKLQFLEAQKGELRCLLPRSLLDHGFFPSRTTEKDSNDKCTVGGVHNYSWCGQRKMPSYLNKLVFPEDFLTALRTIAMQEDELYQATSLLNELVDSGEERQPSDIEVRAAIWEACGDSGALQLLVDRLNMKMMDLEEGSGTEDHDSKLLEEIHNQQTQGEFTSCQTNGSSLCEEMSENRRSSIVYRRGQKRLTRLFLREAEHALQLALSEGN